MFSNGVGSFSGCVYEIVALYRVTYLLVALGWVDFDLGVPPSCPPALAASAKFPSAKAESGRQWNTQNPSQQNPVHDQVEHPVQVLFI